MTSAYFVTHPDVEIDPQVPITEWSLSARGRERLGRLSELPWSGSLTHVFCSAELKAREAAAFAGGSSGCPVTVTPALGEIDRSATGYLPAPEFWAVVEEFFRTPGVNVRGWESAASAQARVVSAVQSSLEATSPDEAVAFVAHGGVGTLLLCHLKGVPISSALEQPSAPQEAPAGAGGGWYFAFDRHSLELLHDWRRVDPD